MSTMKCNRCGSEKVMTNLRVQVGHNPAIGARGQDLEVEVQRNPDALIFKQTQKEALRATVCGECGNASLSVENPQALWRVYTERKDS